MSKAQKCTLLPLPSLVHHFICGLIDNAVGDRAYQWEMCTSRQLGRSMCITIKAVLIRFHEFLSSPLPPNKAQKGSKKPYTILTVWVYLFLNYLLWERHSDIHFYYLNSVSSYVAKLIQGLLRKAQSVHQDERYYSFVMRELHKRATTSLYDSWFW